MGIANSLHASA